MTLCNIGDRILEDFGLSQPKSWGVKDTKCDCGKYMEVLTDQQIRMCPRCRIPIPFVDQRQQDMGGGKQLATAGRAQKRRNRSAQIKTMRAELNLAQNKDKKEISLEDQEQVVRHLIKQGIDRVEDVTTMHVYNAIHELHMNKLYPHAVRMTVLITNRPAPQLPNLYEEKHDRLNDLIHKCLAAWNYSHPEEPVSFQKQWLPRYILNMLANTASLPKEEQDLCRQVRDNIIPTTKTKKSLLKYERAMNDIKVMLGMDVREEGIVLLPEAEALAARKGQPVCVHFDMTAPLLSPPTDTSKK